MRKKGRCRATFQVVGAWLAAGAIWLATLHVSAALAAAQEPKTPALQQERKAFTSKLVVRPPQQALVPSPQCTVPAEAQMVRCDTISLTIPADAIVTRVVRKVRETGDEVPHTFWIDDDGAYAGCKLRPGWCSAEAIKQVKQGDKLTFSYGVRNWKFDRDREFLLEIYYTQPSGKR